MHDEFLLLEWTTPDVLICFNEGTGTICELAFGLAVGRQAIFHDNCAQNLLDKCIGERGAKIEQTLSRVSAKWQTHLQLPNSNSDAMIKILIDYLRKATRHALLTSAETIVEAALLMLPSQLSDIHTLKNK